MTIDDLLERYGRLMFEAGQARSEIAIAMRHAQVLHELPDAPVSPPSRPTVLRTVTPRRGAERPRGGEMTSSATSAIDHFPAGFAFAVRDWFDRARGDRQWSYESFKAVASRLESQGIVEKAGHGQYRRAQVAMPEASPA